MNRSKPEHPAVDLKLAAVCGLFCPACTVYIASIEEPERLQALAARFGVSTREMECHGCRSEKRGLYCHNHCTMTRCAREKGVDFCGQCPDYPCADLTAFQSKMPHRIELWSSLERIRSAGYETWFTEMAERYSCPECGTINSAYDRPCRACDATPSCEFVRLHESEVAALRDRLGPAR